MTDKSMLHKPSPDKMAMMSNMYYENGLQHIHIWNSYTNGNTAYWYTWMLIMGLHETVRIINAR